MADPFEGLDATDPGQAPVADPFAGLDASDPGQAPAPRPVMPTVHKQDPGTAGDTAADAAVGAGTGLAMDWDDEIVGGLAAFGKYARNVPGVGPLFQGAGMLAQAGTGQDTYEGARDAYRDRKKLAAVRSPVANTIGQLAGGAAGAFAGGMEAKGLKAVGTLLAEGAGQGLGASEATDAVGLAQDAGQGAAMSALTAGALKGAGKLVGAAMPGNMIQRLERGAEKSEAAAAGLNLREVKKSPGGIPEQVATQRKYGVGGGVAGKNTILDQASQANKQVDTQRKALAQKFEQTGVNISGHDVANRLDAAANDLPRDAMAEAQSLRDLANEYRTRPSMSFSEVNDNRAYWGDKTKFASDLPKQQIQKKVHGILNDTLEQNADKAHPALGRAWRDLGRDQAKLIRVEEGAENALNSDAKQKMSFREQGMLAGAAVLSSPLLAAGFVASRVAKGREHSLAATAQRKGAAALRKVQAATNWADPAIRPIGKALNRSIDPGARAIGKLVASHSVGQHATRKESNQAAVDAGSAAVQEALQQGGPEEAARAHYLESMTNPQYRAETMKDSE